MGAHTIYLSIICLSIIYLTGCLSIYLREKDRKKEIEYSRSSRNWQEYSDGGGPLENEAMGADPGVYSLWSESPTNF